MRLPKGVVILLAVFYVGLGIFMVMNSFSVVSLAVVEYFFGLVSVAIGTDWLKKSLIED